MNGYEIKKDDGNVSTSAKKLKISDDANVDIDPTISYRILIFLQIQTKI